MTSLNLWGAVIIDRAIFGSCSLTVLIKGKVQLIMIAVYNSNSYTRSMIYTLPPFIDYLHVSVLDMVVYLKSFSESHI